jgi:peptide/nickel transport system permease protein
MLTYIVRRILGLIPLLILISMVSFAIIQLPPGSFLDTYVANQASKGGYLADTEVARLKLQYGLDEPIYWQYYVWMRNILLRGDFGRSFELNQPVIDIIRDRIVLTMVITLSTAFFIWAISIPIGIYTATHQYSLFDYFWSFVGFIGVAMPSFLVALIFVWIFFSIFHTNIIGLYSEGYADTPFSLAKVWDLFKHLWAPVLIIGLSGTAGLIRVVRGTLLDELHKQYVITARAKGLSEGRLLLKYPVRMIMNPIISTIGWMLPALVSGEVLVSAVLNIPTTGPILLKALMSQDMYLAGSIVLILSTLTVIGTLLSDILLVWLDPRIRYEKVSSQ